MFLGTTFFCGKHSLEPPATNITDFYTLSVSDGTYDQLFLSTDTSQTADDLEDDWKYETKLNARFDGDLEGGNVGFSTKNTDVMVIKTRETGSLDWKTIYTIPVSKDTDFQVNVSYPFSRNGSDNEYMLLSMINGIENSYVTARAKTEFSGFYVADKEHVYGTMYNVEMTDTTRNRNTTVIELLNNTYPTVFSNSQCNYATGTTSGSFIRFDPDADTLDLSEGIRYRKEFMDWLCNGNAKILKLEDGRIYLIKITGKPTDTNLGDNDLRNITFDWAEIGSVDSERDLYLNNLSDVTAEFWKR